MLEVVVRKGSAETQDCESCQQTDMEKDNDKSLEDLGFVTRAVSDSAGWHEPLKCMCDQKRNEESFKLNDIASILVEDDGKPHKVNLCGHCCNLRLTDRNESKVTHASWKTMIQQKVSRGRRMGTVCSNKRWRRELLEESTNVVQLETSRWQEESPYNAGLGLLRVSCVVRMDGTLIRQATKAMKAGDWSELLKSDRFNSWTNAELQECYIEVKQEDDERKSTVQNSTAILRRTIVPVEGHGSHCRTCALSGIGMLLKTTSGWR